MTTSRRAPRILSPLSALALAAGLVLASATAASAHDEILGSNPAAGATVAALPSTLELTFSAVLLADQGGNEVRVTDSAGGDLSGGALEVSDNRLIQPLVGTPTGEISVLWRAVSSDGHPISGSLSFTVAPAPTPTVTETVTAPAPAPTTPTSPSATPAPAPTGIDGGAVPWLIGGGILVAGLLVVVIVQATRGRRPDDPAGDAPSTTTER